LLLATVCVPPAWAEDDAWKKAGRGVNNFFLGYYEVVQQPLILAKTERWPIALVGGFFKGLYLGTLRTVAGVVEVVTFPLPIPWGYAPLIQPEFVIDPAYQGSNRWPDWGVD
jgi:putative exosortase-associated protein (TIGR04073 family)